MKRILVVSFLIIMLFTMTGFSGPVHPKDWMPGPQTYTVLVGSENPRLGVSIMSYFPGRLMVHVGDTVHWVANSHEIHTVTFNAGDPLPDFILPAPAGMASPIQINPLAGFPNAPADGMFDGTTFVNSGLMSTDPGQVRTFDLTFTQTGTFTYVCLVHGMMMSAEIDVVDASVPVPSPAQVRGMAGMEMFRAWMPVGGVLADAYRHMVPPVQNSDGTTTYTVNVGWSSGVIDVMRFFPSRLAVKPGDTVVWKLSEADAAPHTVTFLNGNPDPDLVTPVPQPNGPPILLLNPAVVFPSQAVLDKVPLNRTDYFNSGLMNPGDPNTSTFSLTIGNISGRISYMCLLHDTSGMVGSLYVRNDNGD